MNITAKDVGREVVCGHGYTWTIMRVETDLGIVWAQYANGCAIFRTNGLYASEKTPSKLDIIRFADGPEKKPPETVIIESTREVGRESTWSSTMTYPAPTSQARLSHIAWR